MSVAYTKTREQKHSENGVGATSREDNPKNPLSSPNLKKHAIRSQNIHLFERESEYPERQHCLKSYHLKKKPTKQTQQQQQHNPNSQKGGLFSLQHVPILLFFSSFSLRYVYHSTFINHILIIHVLLVEMYVLRCKHLGFPQFKFAQIILQQAQSL